MHNDRSNDDEPAIRDDYTLEIPAMEDLKVDGPGRAPKRRRAVAPLLETVIDALPCPIYYKDRDGLYLGCNRAFADVIIGASPDQIAGKTREDLTRQIPAELTQLYQSKDAGLLKRGGQQTFEARVHCADGKVRPYLFHKSTFNDGQHRIAGVVGIMLDMTSTKNAETELMKYRDRLEEMVTKRSAELMATNNRLTNEIEERHKVESALQANEERYRRVFENTGTATILIEPDMTISMANAKAEKLVGMPRDQFLRKTSILEFVAPEYRGQISLFHELRMKGDTKVPQRYEFQMLNKDGDIRDVLATIQWIPETRQTVASMLDITKGNKLRQERKRLAAVIDQSAEAVVVTDNHGKVQYANQSFESLSGFSLDECIGSSMQAPFFCNEDRQIFQQMTFMVSKDDAWSGRVENKKKNGSAYIADTRIFPICNDQGKAVNLVCVKTDVTHQVQLEKQLQHSQKMEAIGNLAGGIAHDFNNILGGILGYAEISLIRANDNEHLKRNLGRILDGCQRAKELVQNILAFSRKNEEETKPIEIQIIVKEALKLLRASIPSTIEFKQRIHSKASIVHATSTQIHQVVMNLCTNAAQAMQKTGGELEVILENIELTQESCPDIPDIVPGPFVLMTVSDTGQGMPQKTMDRIFEPYFTTKDQTGGTGLGLSVVHGIIKNFGGTIQVTSEQGIGSTFRIYLPRIEDPARVDKPASMELPKGRERILVVDDEQFILEIMGDMLGSLGYEVDTANGGLNALQRFNENPDRYDMVIADLTMPKITGPQLAENIHKQRNNIPIILTTGLNIDTQSKADEYATFAAVLNKPILYTDLAKTMRRILDTPQNP